MNAIGTLTWPRRCGAPRPAHGSWWSPRAGLRRHGDAPADESRPLAPRSPYAASKAAAELAAEQAARAHGLDVVVARPFAHTGPGHDRRFALPSWARRSPRWSARAAAS